MTMSKRFTLFVAILAITSSSVFTDVMTECVATLMPLFQGNCVSDYAVVATTAVELAWCLKDKAKYANIKLAAQDLICNCTDCHTIKGNGCMGGNIEKALNYIKNGQIVGGGYKELPAQAARTIDATGPQNYKECLNYWTPICDPDVEDNCATADFTKTAQTCLAACDRTTGVNVADAKVTGALPNLPTKVTTVQAMKDSINARKPLIGTMELFEDMDFYFGTDKLYIHSNGQSLGVTNVIIVAYGIDTATTAEYWDVLVPWDKKYDATKKIGDQKLRVIAGINHCNIENYAWSVAV